MLTNRHIERLIAVNCGGRGGFRTAVEKAIIGTSVSMLDGSSGGTIFPGDDDAYGVRYSLSTPEGCKTLTLRITVEDESC